MRVQKAVAPLIVSTSHVGRFVIGTPTKCATTTLEELTRRHAGGRVSRGGVPLDSFRMLDWERPRRQHRMALPRGEEWLEADRFLMVRDPWARYVSIYKYLGAPANYTKWGSAEIQGRSWRGHEFERGGFHHPYMTFAQFLTFMQESRVKFYNGRWVRRRGLMTDPAYARSPWVWTDSLWDSWATLAAQPQVGRARPVELLKMEHLWDELEMLRDRYDLKSLSLRRSIHANKCLTYGGEGVEAFYKGMCGPDECLGVTNECVTPDPATGEACAACRLGVHKEAMRLGYCT